MAIGVEIDIAATVCAAACQNISRMCRQQLLAIADIDLVQQAGGKGELAGFAGKRQRLHRSQRQQRQWIVLLGRAQVVGPVESADALDQTTEILLTLFGIVGRIRFALSKRISS